MGPAGSKGSETERDTPKSSVEKLETRFLWFVLDKGKHSIVKFSTGCTRCAGLQSLSRMSELEWPSFLLNSVFSLMGTEP